MVSETMSQTSMECDEPDETKTLEKVREIMSVAKIEETEVKNIVQEIYFGDLSQENSTVLMEVPEDLISQISSGQRTVFRGEEDDPVVLCCGPKTYEVREAEVSNQLFFMPDFAFPEDASMSTISQSGLRVVPTHVTVIKQNYLELRPIKPKTRRIKELLAIAPYAGREKELDIDEESRVFFSTEYLLEKVQASEPELQDALKAMRACKINGAWRTLKPEYELRVLNHFLNFIEENSWPLDEIHKDITITTLRTLEPEEVLEQVFEYYFEVNKDKPAEHRMNTDRVSRCMGETLLRQSEKFDLADFLAAWQESVPSGIRTNLSQLAGVAFVNKSVQPSYIERFAAENLPDNIPDRLAVLFKKRDKWLLDDISPFVEDLTTEKMTANALLTKHARATIVGGKKFFCAKHGK